MNKWKVGVLLSVFGFLGVMNPGSSTNSVGG